MVMRFIDKLLGRTAFAEDPIPSKPSMDEVATSANGRDITRGFVDALPILQPTDTVLQARGAGDLRIYDEVARDSQVKACIQQRWLAVASKEWAVDPGDNSRKAKKAADHLRDVITRIAWDDATIKMLSGEFYGFAVAEALWATDGGMITLDAIKVRQQRRFGFSPKGELRLLTSQNPLGEAVPPAKFWAYSTGSWHDDDPYGLGLAHWLYWPVFFKRNDIKFWLIFLEKFGMPTALGRYPEGTSEAKKTMLLSALSAIQMDSAITIPEGMAVDLLEAARSGTADYTSLHDRMDEAISKVILGHTGSTDATAGRLGGESNAAEVRDDLVKAASDLVCGSFNRTIARWLTYFNDQTAPTPRVWRRVESEPDLSAQAARDKNLFDMGFRPTIKYISETYATEVTDTQPQSAPIADVTAQNPQPQSSDVPTFAEPSQLFTPQQQAVEHLANTALANPVQPITDELIASAIRAARDPVDLENRLAVLLHGVQHSEFNIQLERALFEADILGYAHAGEN